MCRYISKHLRSRNQPYYERLVDLLSQDLDFHHQDSSYASHNYHAFPAKFPPQLPRVFIQALTNPGDAVLDPMMGSGTTILEAFLAGRRGIGCDIDPLAALITKVKVTPLDSDQVRLQANELLTKATQMLNGGAANQPSITENHFDPKTRTFINYWFHDDTQTELGVLVAGINAIPDPAMKAFFQLAFSAIIITKSGGVSLALDLAHTRPHRAKLVMDVNGSILYGQELAENPSPRAKYVTKTLRSPLVEYRKRIRQNLNHLVAAGRDAITPDILFGDAQNLPIQDDSIDLIVTSPPYASNAIDYMRAHKFSLVWMGYPIQNLGDKRREYIGGESTRGLDFEALPSRVANIVSAVSDLDPKKGRVLHRYYSEMAKVFREMFRVLRPGKAAIVVVGNSIMRGIDTDTAACLADIGKIIGFESPRIGVRNLDRNRRMMPVGSKTNLDSQIQQRMHEEYVIGLYKPPVS